jgi:hypothetical protein
MIPDWSIAFLIGGACVFAPRLVGGAAGGLLQIATIVGLPFWALSNHPTGEAALIILAGFAGLVLAFKAIGGTDGMKQDKAKPR